ncbi:MAG: hypothetical protein ACXVLQ_05845 [Bacteriovorax sp.]
MILELFTYFRATASKEAKAFGHLYESIAIKERERRCKPYWLAHRTSCKKFIKEAVAKARAHDRVLVLGSGPLHEIPLEDLASTFKRVDLADIVHLKETIEQYKHLKNVHFIQADITELESIIHKEKKIYNKVPTLFQSESYDLVISANLLSQLSYHLRNFLEKKASSKLSEEELDKFCYQVSLDHYRYITHFPCPVVLITDIETHLIGKNEELLEVQTPYINFKLPTPQERWWWDVAPIPEYSKKVALKMKVAGFLLNV